MAIWKFYTYAVTNDDGEIIYIGKGSGRRRLVSEKRGVCSHEVARFKREKDAYKHECELIAEYAPIQNKHPGGNGSRCQVERYRKTKEDREIERLGTRRYAARMIINKYLAFNILRSKEYYPDCLIETMDNLNIAKLYEVAYG